MKDQKGDLEDLEVFNLSGRPRPKPWCNWSCGNPKEFVAILGFPIV
ncbi:MAG TPA: hypothetical protein VME24_09995 [Alphaproteobacteria bacterium]|nr:hypothetical protein [Alphaproteobacteria bacterium]